LTGAAHWYLRTSPFMLSQEGVERPTVSSPQAPKVVNVSEFGTRFRIHLDEQSHKTGFFCDQRDNRRMLAQFCQGKSVLDLCCYTGGFSVQAKKLGQAAEVTGVDLDAAPLEVAKANANLNQVRAKFVQADVFPYMRDMLRSERQFDVVVLDPPKLIRSRAELEEGTRKHLDLNRLAIQLVKPGGLFLTCTCAGLLSAAEFTQVVARAARQAGQEQERFAGGFKHGRELQIFARTGAAPDHPVSGNSLEGEYLNAIWARVG
jgi:23S rRNA (cytosine1962-C5)-methyltransferase